MDEDGAVTLSSTRPVVGTEITASLTDDDGELSGVTWQWANSGAMDGTYTDIEEATSAAYTPTMDDEGMPSRRSPEPPGPATPRETTTTACTCGPTASYTDGEGSGKSAIRDNEDDGNGQRRDRGGNGNGGLGLWPARTPFPEFQDGAFTEIAGAGGTCGPRNQGSRGH